MMRINLYNYGRLHYNFMTSLETTAPLVITREHKRP